jgi:hypothetical protein
LKELNYLTPRAYVFTPYWSDTGDPALSRAMQQALADPKADEGALLSQAAGQAQAALDRPK